MYRYSFILAALILSAIVTLPNSANAKGKASAGGHAARPATAHTARPGTAHPGSVRPGTGHANPGQAHANAGNHANGGRGGLGNGGRGGLGNGGRGGLGNGGHGFRDRGFRGWTNFCWFPTFGAYGFYVDGSWYYWNGPLDSYLPVAYMTEYPPQGEAPFTPDLPRGAVPLP